MYYTANVKRLFIRCMDKYQIKRQPNICGEKVRHLSFVNPFILPFATARTRKLTSSKALFTVQYFRCMLNNTNTEYMKSIILSLITQRYNIISVCLLLSFIKKNLGGPQCH